jgi:predicted phosphodiesterase
MYNVYAYSDLHLETRKDTLVLKPTTDKNNICVLAGDIGDPQSDKFWEFIQCTCNNFDLVLFVAGNHEYFNSCIDITNSLLKTRETSKFKVLNKDTVYFSDIDTLIIGCTLWSYIPKYAVWSCIKNISNYKWISNFTIEQNNALFLDHLDFIHETLKNSKAKRKIVITHHAPLVNQCIKSVYLNSSTVHSYATNIHELVKLANIWIFGHTHFTTNVKYENCTLYSNQLGYSSDTNNFNKDFYIQLTTDCNEFEIKGSSECKEHDDQG